ncbi:MAG TPA: Ig-like domain-containing protein, partial [Candidatus Eremiobacteraceae bacterium]|nr:Ig-like domain-containing protein [Candidatus Eremiobacteraceae bacterium]
MPSIGAGARMANIFAGRFFLMGFAALAFGCAHRQAPLAAVAPAPAPSLPSWISEISPQGMADPLSQIRVIFKAPLIPVESIESPDAQAMLAKFSIVPALPGHFRFLTPRMVGFEADAALPLATRVQVRLAAGLRDLYGDHLDRDVIWTFQTAPVTLSELPGTDDNGALMENPDPGVVRPHLHVRANTELDVESLREHTQLAPEQGGAPAPVDIERDTSSPAPSQCAGCDSASRFDASKADWVYDIVPKADLAKGTRYSLNFAPGIEPAHGNVPSSDTFVGRIVTFAPLALQSHVLTGKPGPDGPSGRFVNGILELDFNNGLDAASAAANITISPAPSDAAHLLSVSDGDNTLTLNPAVLSPDTAYTVTIGPGLKDQFGQTIGKTQTVAYRSGDLAGDIWAAEGLHVFPLDTGLRLDIATVNLPEKRYSAAYRVLSPSDLVRIDPQNADISQLLPDPSNWTSYPVATTKNQLATTPVPITDKLGGPTGLLAYGIAADTNRIVGTASPGWRQRQLFGVVELTDLGVFAQWFPASGLVRVNRLSDGAPVAGASIDVYPSYANDSNPGSAAVSVCAAATTDATGTAHFDAAAVAPCMQHVSSKDQPPDLLTVAKSAGDWTYVLTSSWDGGYGYGIYGGWDAGNVPQSCGAVYSDRFLYQPGETVRLSGAAFALSGGVIRREGGVPFRVTLDDPNGNHTLLGTTSADSFGAFSISAPLTKNQALGYYTVTATGNDGLVITGDFRVAQFRAPNFKVALTLDKKYVTAGASVNAQATSSYLFGAPVEGGTAQYYVTRTQAAITPKGWDTYTFGPQWFWPDQAPDVQSDVLQTTQTIDSKGASALTIPVAADLPFPMSYRVDMQTTDVSHLSVSDSKSFTALPSLDLIGLHNDWVATAGKPFTENVIVVDPDGSPVAGKRVHLELQSMNYIWAGQIVEGGEAPQDRVLYTTVDQTDVSSGTSAVAISFTPKSSGSYRIRANFADAPGTGTESDDIIYASGDEPYAWGNENPDGVQVKLDKSNYKVGDLATALIESPYPAAELYFAVIRRGVIMSQISQVKGSAPRVQFRVTPDMIPNAAVQAVLVRRGRPIGQLASGSLDSLARAGFAPFNTDLGAHYLKLAVRPARATIEPGQTQTVRLSLHDSAGRATAGELAVMVINEAVLQLTGYRPPDLVKIVFADQPVSTRFSDSRPNVVLSKQKLAGEKGWGYGGGFSGGAAGTRVRTNFQPIAYYNGAVRTDATGNASVSFALPDDLTTWRVMAVAIGAPGEPGSPDPLTFGQADATFIANKPLVTNALLPQFARPGDEFQGGVSVTNSTGAPAQVSIKGLLTGPLAFAGPTSSEAASYSSPVGTSAYRFDMKVGSNGTASVRFDSTLSGRADAFSVPLDVVTRNVLESTVESGSTQSTATVPVRRGPDVAPDMGGLRIMLASSLVPEVAGPARQMIDDYPLPFAETAASRLRAAADIAIINKRFAHPLSGVDPVAVASTAVSQLEVLQLGNGGLAIWPGAKKASPLDSSYAALALVRAKEAGLSVDAGLLQRLGAYLASNLSNPYDDICTTDLCAAEARFADLQALAALGHRRTDFLPEIYDMRDRLCDVTRIELALYLSQTPGWESQAKGMSDAIARNVYITGRGAALSLPQSWRWYDSNTAAQAHALRLFVARGAASDVLDKMLKSLLGMRRNGVWGESYDNAEALDAIIDYGVAQGPAPDFNATAALSPSKHLLANERFVGYTDPERQTSVPMAHLPGQAAMLTLTRAGTGTLHFVVSYEYKPVNGLPGAINGVRVLREVRPANKSQVLDEIGVDVPGQPLSLPAGNVYDVGVQIIVDHYVDHVIIDDPLPAG